MLVFFLFGYRSAPVHSGAITRSTAALFLVPFEAAEVAALSRDFEHDRSFRTHAAVATHKRNVFSNGLRMSRFFYSFLAADQQPHYFPLMVGCMQKGALAWSSGGTGGRSRAWMWAGVAAGSEANDITARRRYSTHVVISNPGLFSGGGYYHCTVFPPCWGGTGCSLTRPPRASSTSPPPLPPPSPLLLFTWKNEEEKKKSTHQSSANETFGPATAWLYFCRQKYIWQGLSALNAFCLHVGQSAQEKGLSIFTWSRKTIPAWNRSVQPYIWPESTRLTGFFKQKTQRERKQERRSPSVFPTSHGQLW